MRTIELRKRFLSFFAEREHKILSSSPIVPNDATLLFTAAGMVPFKDAFWGRVTPSFSRAATCQKCFRTTDIENVGRTAYHHTFFEMLGNFSFGDYFKRGAIEFAWAFLIEELGISSDRLSISIYDEDDEAEAIWADEIGVARERIVRLGKKENWWGPVGESGPCGPDSEIFFDAGAGAACGPDCTGVACDCDRFSEIWNLVFMEYDARPDGTFSPLAAKSIDTGMGLERTAAVLQGAGSDYEVDVFRPIIEAIEASAPDPLSEAQIPSRNTIADHIRGIPFLLAEGVMPGNERQGYVMRRILRRAVRAGERLSLPPGSLASFVDPAIDVMCEAYPEIAETRELAARLVAREEETFRRTLREGERRLTKILDQLKADGETTLPGELAFELTDTFGFPLEMICEIAADERLEVDMAGFERALEAQRARSRVDISVTTSVAADADEIPAGRAPTEFSGHKSVAGESVIENVLGDISQGSGRLVFPESPFYAESGGQVADTGRIENLDRKGQAIVAGVAKNEKGVFLHAVSDVEGAFVIGDRCRLAIDLDRRRRIERNHTATHLLHAALREVLGSHATQSGSVVNDRELRFDFSHFEKMTPNEIARVEDIANAAVLADHPVSVQELPPKEAKASGAIGLFEDEYRGLETVRVISVDDVSRELCGGTHVRRSGEIGLIKIVSEESIAAGVRRIRAITGDAVLGRLRDQDAFADRMKSELGDAPEEGARRLRDEVAALNERLGAVGASRVQSLADELVDGAESFGEVRLVAGRADIDGEELKDLGDVLEERSRPAVVILVGNAAGRAIVLSKVSKGVQSVRAGDLVRSMSAVVGGGGGGGPAFAQGGGQDVGQLDGALAAGVEAARDGLS